MPFSDLMAERGVLAGLLKFGVDSWLDVSDIIGVNTFTDNTHQVVYKCIDHIFKSDAEAAVDVPTLISSASSLGYDLQREGHLLRALYNLPIEGKTVRKLAGKIGRLEVGRLFKEQVDAAGRSLESITGDESLSHILGLVENPIFDFTSRLSGVSDEGPRPIGEGLAEYIEYLTEHPRDFIGIPSFYPRYDRAIGGGFRPGTVNVIGARIKQGKTILADNIGANVAFQAIPVLNLDTEMTKEDHWHRLVARLSGVSINDIERGRIPKSKKEDVKNAVIQLQTIPYDYLSIGGQEFEDTLAEMRRWVLKKVGLGSNGKAKPCLIIFDYLKLMSAGILKDLQEFQALGFMMTSLHNFMLRYGVACLLLTQLNRDGIDKEATSVVAGSDRVMWLCSNFTIYKEQSEDEMAEQTGDRRNAYNKKLVTLVSRHGPAMDGGDYIHMRARNEIALIEEGPMQSEMNSKKMDVQGEED